MNTGMGTMLSDKTAFSGASLLPTSLVNDLDSIKNVMSRLDLNSLNNAVCQFISLEWISELIFFIYIYTLLHYFKPFLLTVCPTFSTISKYFISLDTTNGDYCCECSSSKYLYFYNFKKHIKCYCSTDTLKAYRCYMYFYVNIF